MLLKKSSGRTLSPIEYETIKGWLDSKIGKDLIHQALKEAVLNGVTSLKYIDKILCDCGLKKVRKNLRILKEGKVRRRKYPIFFEYDWLEDDE